MAGGGRQGDLTRRAGVGLMGAVLRKAAARLAGCGRWRSSSESRFGLREYRAYVMALAEVAVVRGTQRCGPLRIEAIVDAMHSSGTRTATCIHRRVWRPTRDVG